MRIIKDIFGALGLGSLFNSGSKPKETTAPAQARTQRPEPSDDTFFRVPASGQQATTRPTDVASHDDFNIGSIPAAHANVPAVQLALGTGSVMDLVSYFDIDESAVTTSTLNFVLADQKKHDDLFSQTLASLCNQLGNPNIKDKSEFIGKMGLQGSRNEILGTVSSKRVLDTLSRLGIVIKLEDNTVTITRKSIDRTKIKPVPDNDLRAIYNSVRPADTEFVYVNGHWYAVEK